jgi:hypothetical protein
MMSAEKRREKKAELERKWEKECKITQLGCTKENENKQKATIQKHKKSKHQKLNYDKNK